MNSFRRAFSSLIFFFSAASRGLIFRFSSSIHVYNCRCSSSDTGGRTLFGAGEGIGSATLAVSLAGDASFATAAAAAAV
jgi:hypothetical protein